MQLFRRQALDHHNRLHGDIFMVPPLRWQAIGWLLLGLVFAGAACLAFGVFSRTIQAEGTLHMSQATSPSPASLDGPTAPPWTARVMVPFARIAQVHEGQKATVSLAGGSETGVLSGTITGIATKVQPGTTAVPVEIRLIRDSAGTDMPQAIDGQPVAATIVVQRVRLWRWLFAPVLPRAER